MKKLDRYLLRQALSPLVFGLLVYSSLAVISSTLPRLQWIVGTPVLQVLKWLILQLPTAMVQTLPIALVLAVILSFGRLASSNELQAVQAGGVSLGRSAIIFVYLGAALTAGALLINERVLPYTNAQVGSLYWQLTSGTSNSSKSGLWRLAAQDIPLNGFKLNFRSANEQTDELNDVRIETWQDKQLTVIFASTAKFVEGGLELYTYQSDTLNFSALSEPYESSDELLKRFVKSHSLAPNATSPLLLTTSESPEELITRFSNGGFEDSRSISEVYKDSQSETLSPKDKRLARVLFNRKLAEPFANLTLLLIAVPLSLLYAGNRGVAFGLSLVVTLAWYLLFTIGQLLGQAGTLPVWLGVWSSNMIMAAVGLYLLIFRTRMR